MSVFAGAGAASVALLGTGPLGLCVGAGACIAIAIGDLFFGDSFWSLFIGDNESELEAIEMKKMKEFERITLDKAYDMFDLTKHCTNEELEERKKILFLKYHPDKCQGTDEEKKEKTLIFQGVFAAYTLIKHYRSI